MNKINPLLSSNSLLVRETDHHMMQPGLYGAIYQVLGEPSDDVVVSTPVTGWRVEKGREGVVP